MSSPNPPSDSPAGTGSEEKPKAAEEFFRLFMRYVVALFVSWISSFAAFFACMLAAEAVGSMALIYLTFPLVGFAGVLLGTLCLRPKSRRFGSVLLLFTGLAYYYGECWFFYRASFFLLLAIGALVAVALTFLRQRPNTY